MGGRLRRFAGWLVVCLAVWSGAAAQGNDYVVGVQDLLQITVFGEDGLAGKYTVEADGTFTFPLVGTVKAAGLTLRGVEALLRDELQKGFFKNPQVSVTVEQYRSQRIFVMGQVRNPGPYPLTGNMTLIEALARAGSTTEDAGGEALIVRTPQANGRQAPLLPDADSQAEVIHVDIKELQNGRLSANTKLQDNDTIFVPRAELVYVFGQVKNPGAYPIQRETTILQALSLAGGVTDRGAVNRIKVARVVNGKRTELRAKMEDPVTPGDTIIVPERFF